MCSTCGCGTDEVRVTVLQHDHHHDHDHDARHHIVTVYRCDSLSARARRGSRCIGRCDLHGTGRMASTRTPLAATRALAQATTSSAKGVVTASGPPSGAASPAGPAEGDSDSSRC
jgi:hypothetical protein